MRKRAHRPSIGSLREAHARVAEAQGSSGRRQRIRTLGGTLALLACAAILVAANVDGQETLSAARAAPTFEVVDVYVDGDEPLAAWQFELEEADGRMQVVGIEGGDAAPFAAAPYYDRDAVDGGRADRIIVASFSTEPPAALPLGRTRVASVHVRLAPGTTPDFRLTLIAAGAPDGRPIDAEISFATRNGRSQQ